MSKALAKQAAESNAFAAKWKPYPVYKKTNIEWIEKIPKHWEIKKIKYLLMKDGYKAGPFGSSLITSELLDEGNILVITPEHIAKECLNLPINQYLKESRSTEMAAFLVDINDVIFPIVGTLGRAMVILEARSGIINQRLAKLTPDIIKLQAKYLKLLLTDVDFYKKLDDIESKGAILNHITKEKIINRPIFLPPIEEQNQILAFLDNEIARIDSLIEKQQRLIRLLQEQRQAVIFHAVTKGLNPNAPMKDTGIKWLGKVPDHWEVKPAFAAFTESKTKNIGAIEKHVLSLSYGQLVTRDIESNFGLLPESFETYQIVECGNIIMRLTDLQNDQRSLRVGIAKERGIITSAYLCLNVKTSITSAYAYQLLHSYDLSKIFYGIGGGVRQSMGFDDLKRITILLPPIPEQELICKALEDKIGKIDLLVAKSTEAIVLMKEHRVSLITAAVTGKIDVRKTT